MADKNDMELSKKSSGSQVKITDDLESMDCNDEQSKVGQAGEKKPVELAKMPDASTGSSPGTLLGASTDTPADAAHDASASKIDQLGKKQGELPELPMFEKIPSATEPPVPGPLAVAYKPFNTLLSKPVYDVGIKDGIKGDEIIEKRGELINDNIPKDY